MESQMTPQHQLARLNAARMQTFFGKVYPGCRVHLVTCETDGLTYLQIDGVVAFLIERSKGIVSTKIFRHSDGGRLFLFDNSPKEGDRDRRLKTHVRMWQLFVNSQQGKDVLSRWRIPTGNATLNRMLENGMPTTTLRMVAKSPEPDTESEYKKYVPRQPVVKPRKFPVQRFNILVVQDGKHGNQHLDAFLDTTIQFRKVAEQRIILFTQNPLMENLVHRLKQRQDHAKFDLTFQWAQTLEELTECFETAQTDKADYVDLHLIVDAPDLVEVQVERRNWFNTRSQTFKAIALQDVAEACPIISVIIPEPKIEKVGEQWADHLAE
jgi:hypothetical protein